MTGYTAWFEAVAGFAPHPWQRRIGDDATPSDRLLRIPTGLGKSAGTILPWLYAVHRKDSRWPRRLAFVLPMRTLADQVAKEATAWIAAAALDVPVHVLMGGVDALRWVEDLDQPAILVGTQDMLLSRALNRGYSSGRGLWPMEFGALHNDVLWVFDEVQLMGVALATSTQLHAFRNASPERAPLRPVHTWWMSATLQPTWLDSIDFRERRQTELAVATQVPEEERVGGLWDNQKSLEWRQDIGTEDELAELVAHAHQPATQTLVVVNTVKRAMEVKKALEKKLSRSKGSTPPALELVHSRFRPHERSAWTFLGKHAENELPPAGRIIVATQVIEAGVDISSTLLVTDLAPYPSLVQRFGRAARRSGSVASVIVVGSVPNDEKKSAPYTLSQLESAAKALARLGKESRGASVRDLEEAEASWDADFLDEVYPYVPEHLLRRVELEDLFDTSPDLAGSDLDVGRYIRVGDERDIRVFYRALDGAPRTIEGIEPPRREELCAAPLRDFEEWRKKGDKPAYVFDYELGAWRKLERAVPGMTVLLPSSAGGYDARTGWDTSSKAHVEPVPQVAEAESKLVEAGASADNETLSEAEWKTIGFHGGEVAEELRPLVLAAGLSPRLGTLLEIAGRWHDAGKNHEVFANAIALECRPPAHPIASRRDLAKAPSHAWRRPPYPERPGFRHELVSTLALFELLKRASPEHPAVQGFSWAEDTGPELAVESLGPLADELVHLSAEEFDLVAYLVCSHHGKVRTTWASMPRDQESDGDLVFGVKDGDILPALELETEVHDRAMLPALRLSLEPAAMGLGERYGRSWADRTSALRARFGPFALAYLEALFRVADWRASKRTTQEVR